MHPWKRFFASTLLQVYEKLSLCPDLVSHIEGWAKDCEYFASYLLQTYPGSMGHKGSSPSEQKHSSFVAAIGSSFVDDPCVQLQKMVHQQNELNKKRNEQIAQYLCKSSADRCFALDKGDTTAAALDGLSSWGFEL